MECYLVQNGGSNPLNFKVMGNPQSQNPKENTIWVDTDRIHNYYFSATQPENMAEYDVWFRVGTFSYAPFNALKKNGIQVYPISAKQYIGGVWVDKTAKSYQGGKWVDWFNGIILGNNTAVIGDFYTSTNGYGGSASLSGDTLKLSVNEGFQDAGAGIMALYKKTKISGFKTVSATFTDTYVEGAYFEIGIASSPTAQSFDIARTNIAGVAGGITITCIIPDDGGYVGVRLYTDANKGVRDVYVTNFKVY